MGPQPCFKRDSAMIVFRSQVVSLPRFRTALCDPPWPERGAGSKGGKRGADRHYKVVRVINIPDLIMSSPLWHLDDDCHLYLWVTNTFLAKGAGHWVLKELGFRMIHSVTWAKPRGGIGQYRYGQTEHMLFAVRGRAMLPEPIDRGSTLLGGRLIAASRTHSEKPIEQYDECETVSPGPYCELFARKCRRDAWWYWGRLDGEARDASIKRRHTNGAISRIERWAA